MEKHPTLPTSAGNPIGDHQNSITAGAHGPVLPVIEKLPHQNRERIAERTVHAKGRGAFGTLTIPGDTSKYSKASNLLERVIKTIGGVATASAVAFSALAFTATPGSADTRSPAIIPPHQYCLSYDTGGTDCGFTSYAQCEATASGQGAECYGNTPADDTDPWDTRASRSRGLYMHSRP
jgi:hypothetical protein